MDTEEQIYRALQKRLNDMPTGYPQLESGVEMRLLKRLFNPEEAKMATQLSMKLEPVEKIHGRVKKSSGLSKEQLEEFLDKMFLKGLILRERKDGKKLYRNSKFSAGGIYDIQVEFLNPGVVRDFDQYLEEKIAMEGAEAVAKAEKLIAKGKIPPKPLVELRNIPVEKSLPPPDKYPVSSYDDLKQIIKSAGQIAVANCVCRKSKDTIGEPCKVTDLRETCVILRPEHVVQYVDMGIGRIITEDEALEILGKAQADGLVLSPATSKNPDVVCCCCGDCCQFLASIKRAPRPVDFFASNYYSTVDPELCKGCGKCVERCPLDARTIVDKIATTNLDRCIGCGQCVMVCETKASQLKKKDEEIELPENAADLYMKILAQTKSKWHMFKVRLKWALGMRV